MILSHWTIETNWNREDLEGRKKEKKKSHRRSAFFSLFPFFPFSSFFLFFLFLPFFFFSFFLFLLFSLFPFFGSKTQPETAQFDSATGQPSQLFKKEGSIDATRHDTVWRRLSSALFVCLFVVVFFFFSFLFSYVKSWPYNTYIYISETETYPTKRFQTRRHRGVHQYSRKISHHGLEFVFVCVYVSLLGLYSGTL